MTGRPLSLLLALLALTVAVLAPATATAQAADSHAPEGARADWLPPAEWVMSSWLPYDEARLYRLLGVDRETLSHWLDDRRSLGALAAEHGFPDRGAFARRLVAARAVGAAQRRVLERRALDTLTQPHLARHVLFHVFHTPALAEAAPRVFGLSPRRFRTLRNAGNSPQRIAATAGRTPPRLTRDLDAFLQARGARAVRLGAMSARQAGALLREQRGQLPSFIHSRYRTPEQQAIFACSIHRP